MIKDKKFSFVLLVYCIIFYAAWAVLEIFFAGKIENAVNPVIYEVIMECGFKMLIWFVPAIILSRKYDKHMLVGKEGLFKPELKRDCKIFLPVFIIFTAYILISKYRFSGGISVAENFSPVYVLTYFCVGFAEEAVFRAWLLNGTFDKEKGSDFDKQWFPILVNAVMFLAIHFPRWIKEGVFVSNMAGGAFITIILLSIVFSYCFIKSRNIVIPAFLHMWWDLLLTMLK